MSKGSDGSLLERLANPPGDTDDDAWDAVAATQPDEQTDAQAEKGDPKLAALLKKINTITPERAAARAKALGSFSEDQDPTLNDGSFVPMEPKSFSAG